MLSPSELAGLLVCPFCLCPQEQPTTLLCGHSVCSRHTFSVCPVPVCSPNPPANSPPRIPPHSTVRFHPAPPPHQPTHPLPNTPDIPRRPDVVLTSLAALAARTLAALHPPPPDDDDDQDNRPRKRRKHTHTHSDSEDLLSHLRSSALRQRLTPSDVPLISPTTDTALAEYDKRLLEELTCHICYVLFYQPVTTPCQHVRFPPPSPYASHLSFSRLSAQSASSALSITVQSVQSVETTFPIPIFTIIQSTSCCLLSVCLFLTFHPNLSSFLPVLRAFPLLYRERAESIQQDERHARLNTPIFQCTLAFPGIPTLLHIYEPKYRLMLRRCLESPRPSFGMVMPPKPGSPETNYGTMLEIRSVQMLADGRSMVETWGVSRFRILERGTLDGYMVARVERIDDYPDELTDALLDVPEPPSPTPSPSSTTTTRRRTTPSSSRTSISPPRTPPYPTNEELISTCKAFVESIKRGSAPWVVQRLSTTYLVMPSDPALFAFWVAHVLPIEEEEKAKMLPIRSSRMRLLLAVHWIEQLNNNWYATTSSSLFVFQQRVLRWLLVGPVPLLFPLLLVIWFFVSRVFWSLGAGSVVATTSGLGSGSGRV
ncbi:LON peptidase N-terminal domain and RING finger protein 3 [Psilocybe cubensis]|uniref:Lon N-terminal domain-containing protein n=2 Tax=Psilocybe cubensis TaxID=181762 RepID=A0A8H7Y1G6_PSICU|nr:LON peptidase N-terminal domain and RING finger protein 3 [Psilocybe cubensis]KAH9482682.1 LON peptidase N-terminal domain and RING finger protein 3 [Psilocybe cubensis]